MKWKRTEKDLEKKRNFWNSKEQKGRKRERTKGSLLNGRLQRTLWSSNFYFLFFCVDLRIVVDYLCKMIVKGYSFDWSVNFFSPVFEKTREMKRTKWKRTEKDLEKYVYYFEIVCFFKFFSLLIPYIRLRCVFSFCMVSEKLREKVMGLYIHFLLSINIRVFL